MENVKELKSIIRYLPVVLRSSTLFWPPLVVEALKALSAGPQLSNVDSGELLFLAISDMRNSLSLASDLLAFSTANGFSLFFDDVCTSNSILYCSLRKTVFIVTTIGVVVHFKKNGERVFLKVHNNCSHGKYCLFM